MRDEGAGPAWGEKLSQQDYEGRCHWQRSCTHNDHWCRFISTAVLHNHPHRFLSLSLLTNIPPPQHTHTPCPSSQSKLSGLDTAHLTCLLSCWSTLKFEPEPAVMRGVMNEVYTKLPLFDDKVMSNT